MIRPTVRVTAEQVRAEPLSSWADAAASINDSDKLMRVYAAPEWSELHDDGRLWVQALVRETTARTVDNLPRPARGVSIGFVLSLLLWLAIVLAVQEIVS